MIYHKPVLLNEVIEYLNPQPNQNFIDGTLGDGGHADALLRCTSPNGIVIGLDVDAQALKQAKKRLEVFGGRIVYVHNNFREIEKIYEQRAPVSINGILCDLGVSRRHIETSGYGISFQKDGPLLMRLDGRTEGLTAFEVVNHWNAKEIERVIKEYGEESAAGKITEAIVRARRQAPIKTTGELMDIIIKAKFPNRRASLAPPYGRGEGRWRIHPATKSFQAFRIAVNDELGALKDFLPRAVNMLIPGGRLAVITFHSLEDRIVKQFVKRESRACVCQSEAPICTCGHTASIKILTKKPVVASRGEVRNNPRSRSAKLRVVEKI